MNPRPRVRKTIKRGGMVATALMVEVEKLLPFIDQQSQLSDELEQRIDEQLKMIAELELFIDERSQLSDESEQKIDALEQLIDELEQNIDDLQQSNDVKQQVVARKLPVVREKRGCDGGASGGRDRGMVFGVHQQPE